MLDGNKRQFPAHGLRHRQLGQSLQENETVEHMVLIGYFSCLTLACSTAMVAAFSASRCRRSLSLSEKIATERALFTSFCLRRDFLAANSAAEKRFDLEATLAYAALLHLPFASSSVLPEDVDGADAAAA